MYLEVCKHCKPAVEYWRIFDTTPLTSRFQHKTNRICRLCGNPLIDTIVHFGERGSLKWPLNWSGATKAVQQADVILCLGSSLKVLKKYPWLWALDRPQKQRPKVYIVNLQWTPKDSISSIKINGKCDDVMKLVMKHLQIEVQPYDRAQDPIFYHASLLKEEELHTTSQPMLKRFILKSEDLSEMDESNAGTCSTDRRYSYEKQTTSNDSEDSKSQIEPIMNFSCIKKEVKVEDIKLEQTNVETESLIKSENKNTEAISEVLDLTIDDDSSDQPPQTNGVHVDNSDVVDFEALIDNLDVKVSCEKEEIKIEDTSKGVKINEASFIQQNQSLIDMALLNNSLLTASLALTPVGSTSREALTATALIMNYNNQIINTLTNNMNRLPYKSVENGATNVSLRSKQNCDKSSPMKREVLDNDIEMVKLSDEDSAVGDGETTAPSAEQYYKQLLTNYCMAINGSLPKWSKQNEAAKETNHTVTWSDVNYAYSGLHTIVNLPPEDANLWKSSDEETLQVKKKLRSSTAAERKAAKADCKFCFENYETMECQFYKPINRQFKVTAYRNGKTIVCECCDFTEDDEEETEEDNSKTNGEGEKEKAGVVIRPGWFGKGECEIFKSNSI